MCGCFATGGRRYLTDGHSAYEALQFRFSSATRNLPRFLELFYLCGVMSCRSLGKITAREIPYHSTENQCVSRKRKLVPLMPRFHQQTEQCNCKNLHNHKNTVFVKTRFLSTMVLLQLLDKTAGLEVRNKE
jgi:hypothetical protein